MLYPRYDKSILLALTEIDGWKMESSDIERNIEWTYIFGDPGNHCTAFRPLEAKFSTGTTLAIQHNSKSTATGSSTIWSKPK